MIIESVRARETQPGSDVQLRAAACAMVMNDAENNQQSSRLSIGLRTDDCGLRVAGPCTEAAEWNDQHKHWRNTHKHPDTQDRKHSRPPSE